MTKIAISNIAWPAEFDEEAVGLAAELGFDGIELAPMKVFGPLDSCPKEHVAAYRQRLADRGLVVPALQAILFGVKHCELFESADTCRNLGAHLRGVAQVAGALGAGACVFGAPALRDPGEIEREAAFDIATNFFADLAETFEAAGSTITFEAIPAYYKCRFITKTHEAIELVNAVNRPGFKLQIDTGTMFINGEDISVIADAAPLAGHFHASEKDLAPLGSLGSNHDAIAAALARSAYGGWRSIEMRSTPGWRDNMRAALDLMRRTYNA